MGIKKTELDASNTNWNPMGIVFGGMGNAYTQFNESGKITYGTELTRQLGTVEGFSVDINHELCLSIGESPSEDYSLRMWVGCSDSFAHFGIYNAQYQDEPTPISNSRENKDSLNPPYMWNSIEWCGGVLDQGYTDGIYRYAKISEQKSVRFTPTQLYVVSKSTSNRSQAGQLSSKTFTPIIVGIDIGKNPNDPDRDPFDPLGLGS